MTMLADPLAMLLALVRDAARQGAAEALAAVGPVHAAPAALVTKQAAASALGISTATLDRLVRAGRVPFVRVGDVRRFDLDAVRAALATVEARAQPATTAAEPKRGTIAGVRLLSRGGRP